MHDTLHLSFAPTIAHVFLNNLLAFYRTFDVGPIEAIQKMVHIAHHLLVFGLDIESYINVVGFYLVGITIFQIPNGINVMSNVLCKYAEELPLAYE